MAPTAGSSAERQEGGGDLRLHGLVHGIELVGAAEGDQRHAALRLDRQGAMRRHGDQAFSTVMSPAASRAAISAFGMPNSARISRPCSPTSGAGRSIAGRRLAHLHGRRHHPHPAAARVLVVGDHAHVPHLRVLGGAADVLDHGAPDVGGEQARQQRLGGEPPRLGVDLVEHLVALVEQRLQVVIDGELRRFEHLVEGLEGAHGDRHVAAVAGLVDAERRLHARMADARVGADEVLAEVEHRDIFLVEMRQHAGQEIDLDLLPLAGLLAPVERGEDAIDHVHGADLVGQPGAGRHRRLVAAPGVGDQPGQALDKHVLSRPVDIGPFLAVAGAGAVDDPRVYGTEILVAVAELGKHARPEVLHHHIGLPGHLHHHPMHLAALEIEGDRPLVAVPGQEVRALRAAHPFGKEGHGAEQIASARPLDLDDVGSHVAQKLSGERPLQQMAEIQDGDAVESLVHGRVPLRSLTVCKRYRRWGT